MILVVGLANLLGAAVATPQAIRLFRLRRVEGVSSAWVGISLGINAWWIAYGVGAGDSSWAMIPVGAISVTAYLVIGLALVRFSHRPRRSVLVGLAVPAVIGSIVPLPALYLGGWPATGVVLGAVYGVQLLPAVIAVYRARDLTGVSVTTWVMTWSEALLWGLYGIGPRDAGILTFAATGLVMSTAVLVALMIRRPPTEPPTNLIETAAVSHD